MVVAIVQSCEDNNIDPASYENYISVSADQYPAVSPDGMHSLLSQMPGVP